VARPGTGAHRRGAGWCSDEWISMRSSSKLRGTTGVLTLGVLCLITTSMRVRLFPRAWAMVSSGSGASSAKAQGEKASGNSGGSSPLGGRVRATLIWLDDGSGLQRGRR
jgi:hypothetical protein